VTALAIGLKTASTPGVLMPALSTTSDGTIAAHDKVDALVIGTTFLDIVLAGLPRSPRPGEEIWANDRVLCPGGIANNAVALARLGLTTAIVTPLGTDASGDLVAGMLAEEVNLDLRRLHRDAGIDTPVTVSLGWGEDRALVSHGRLDPLRVTAMASTLPLARTCFVSLQPEPAGWWSLERSHGAQVFAGVGYDDRHGWSASILEQLDQVDTLVLNEMEALAYTRADDLDGAMRQLAELVPTVVVTRGAHGVRAIDSSGAGTELDLPALPISAVDATGAGDSFVSALMHAFVVGGTLVDRLRYAVVGAGLTVSRLGGSNASPRVDEILAWCRSHAVDQPEYAGLPEWLMSARSLSPSHNLGEEA
jgi:sugar/nucleoside kinase (ribokinase family)